MTTFLRLATSPQAQPALDDNPPVCVLDQAPRHLPPGGAPTPNKHANNEEES